MVKDVIKGPHLVDRADGVRGHFNVGRLIKDGAGHYREVWLPKSRQWGTGSGVTWTEVFATQVRDALLAGQEPPTATAADIKSVG